MVKLYKYLIIPTILLLLLTSSSALGQEWQELGDPPFNRHHSNGYGIDGKAYIFEGGSNGTPESNNVWEYTPETDTWVRIADFPGTGRGFAIGDDWDGKYYYGFGNGPNDTSLNDLWVFDPADMSYTELPTCPCVGRAHPAFIANNDKVYVGTGSSDNGDVDDLWIYDILTQEWTESVDLPGGNRHHPFSFSIDEKIFVGGGHRDNWAYFDPTAEQWFAIDDTPGDRVAGTQFSYNNRGYLLAGDTGDHEHLDEDETFMRYDLETEEWEYLPQAPIGSRWAPSSFVIDGIVYFFGGLDFENFNNRSMWSFSLMELDGEVSAINDSFTESELDVYPNPFVSEITIDNIEPNTNISILNMDGKTVYKYQAINRVDKIDLSHLVDGIYFIKNNTDQSTKHLKVIKQGN